MPSVTRAESQSQPSLEQTARRIGEVSTLPHVALRIIQVANDPDSGARELKEVMESDAALSSRVLRCANSSAYAARTRITNLKYAIAYLGVQQIRNLAVSASASELFKQQEAIGCYNRPQLWRHLVSVGIGARMLAMRLSMANFEDVFLAGLLHDLGIVCEDQHLHGAFSRVMQTLSPNETLVAAERRVIGFDHTQLAEILGRQWRFPEAVVAAMRYHHDSSFYEGPALDAVRCVEVANLICSIRVASSVGVNLVRVAPDVITSLALNRDDLLVLSADLERELASNENMLAV